MGTITRFKSSSTFRTPMVSHHPIHPRANDLHVPSMIRALWVWSIISKHDPCSVIIIHALKSSLPQSNCKRGHVGLWRFLRWLIWSSVMTCSTFNMTLDKSSDQEHPHVWHCSTHPSITLPIYNKRLAIGHSMDDGVRGIAVSGCPTCVLEDTAKSFFNSSYLKGSDRPKGHSCPQFPTSFLPGERGHIEFSFLSFLGT